MWLRHAQLCGIRYSERFAQPTVFGSLLLPFNADPDARDVVVGRAEREFIEAELICASGQPKVVVRAVFEYPRIAVRQRAPVPTVQHLDVVAGRQWFAVFVVDGNAVDTAVPIAVAVVYALYVDVSADAHLQLFVWPSLPCCHVDLVKVELVGIERNAHDPRLRQRHHLYLGVCEAPAGVESPAQCPQHCPRPLQAADARVDGIQIAREEPLQFAGAGVRTAADDLLVAQS